MSDFNENVNFRCPACLAQVIDVPMEKCEDGSFRCLKCSYTGTQEDVLAKYADFRSKYTRRNDRVTLEEQRKM